MKEIKTKADILEFDFQLSNANIKLPENSELLLWLNKEDYIKIEKEFTLESIDKEYQNITYKTPFGNTFEILCVQ